MRSDTAIISTGSADAPSKNVSLGRTVAASIWTALVGAKPTVGVHKTIGTCLSGDTVLYSLREWHSH